MNASDFLAMIQVLYAKGELSDQDFATFQDEIKAQEELQHRLELIEEVAAQMVAVESMDDAENKQLP